MHRVVELLQKQPLMVGNQLCMTVQQDLQVLIVQWLVQLAQLAQLEQLEQLEQLVQQALPE
jgi:hypothetical protein